MTKYVGMGLPKFTQRTLQQRIRKHGGRGEHDVADWMRSLRLAYKRAYGKEAPKRFDALDMAMAIKAAWNAGRRPCLSGAAGVFAQMIPANVAEAIVRNIHGRRGVKFTRARDFFDVLTDNTYGTQYRNVPHRDIRFGSNIDKLIAVLKRARARG